MKPQFECYLQYDPNTGHLHWVKPTGNRVRAGSIAGFQMQHGYRCVCFRGKYYLAHRIAWYLQTGTWPKKQIDHRDGNPSNNKWNNLREASVSQNGMNKRLNSNNTSGYKGVSWHVLARKWVASIEINGKAIWLGGFTSRKKAHLAYANAAKEHFGEFARAR